jgi:hypothetical protein
MMVIFAKEERAVLVEKARALARGTRRRREDIFGVGGGGFGVWEPVWRGIGMLGDVVGMFSIEAQKLVVVRSRE